MKSFLAFLAALCVTLIASAGSVNNQKTGNPIGVTGTVTANHVAVFNDSNGNSLKDGGAASGGTVTSISSPNGTITVGSPTTTPTVDVVYGTAANTATQGNDSRVVNAVPNTITVAGHALSSNVSIACADLSNGATGCSTPTGTSGATIPLLNAMNTWSGAQTLAAGGVQQFSGSTTGNSFSNTGTPPITSGIWERVTGSTLSSNTRDFNWGVSYSPNVNLPGDSRGDTVVSIGWNVKGDATCQDATDSCTRIGFEDHYLQAGAAPAANEIHIASRDTGGTEHRAFSYFAPKNGGSGSSLSLASDAISLFNYAGTQRIKFDSVANVISFPNGDYQIQFGANNAQDLKQKNAAGSAFITLIYDDSDDRVRIPNNFASVAGTPTTGTYANQFAVFQATSMPTGGRVLQVTGPSVTGNYTINQFSGNATTTLLSNFLNNNTTSTADMQLNVSVASSAAGNPYITYTATSSTAWYVGQHNSDSHSFKWATNTFGSGSDKMRLDATSGQLALEIAGGGYAVKEGSNAKQGTSTLSAGTVTVSNTNVTANSRIFLTAQSLGTVAIAQALAVTARTAGTSFTITSASATDTSVVAWEIFEPSP